jgi:hypothetical protein
MLDAFKQLIENGIMTEETKTVIESAFTTKLQETREKVTAELREEFAQKYNHDKTVMVEAIDRMLSERLQAELDEFAQDKQSLVEARVAYRRRMKEDSKIMESFIADQLSKEIVEFQGDRKRVAENFGKLEQFVVHALAKEIKEFAIDKKDLAETKVKLVRDARVKFNEIKEAFIKRSAGVVESIVTKKLKSEIKQLKEDIDNARKQDFGRRLFEAFANEYATSHLNEKSETSKLLKVIEKKEVEISEAKTALGRKQKLIESKEREIRVAQDLAERKAVLSEMLAPLGADKRELMRSLLEGVATSKLSIAFDKYLPTVMEGEKKRAVKPALTESVVVTGNREVKPQSQVGDENILEIRKLAGLK